MKTRLGGAAKQLFSAVPAPCLLRLSCHASRQSALPAFYSSKMPAWTHITSIRSSLTKLLASPRVAHSQLRVLMVSPLEKERNERVARNKRRLEELGIQEAAQELNGAVSKQR